MVKNFSLLSKALRPLPLPKVDAEGKVFDEFNDPELRYRQRYVDLVVNPAVKETFIKRTKITNSIREFYNEKGYLGGGNSHFAAYSRWCRRTSFFNPSQCA